MGEESSPACAHPTALRIYVGGVGPAVAAGDIEKTFSSLGRVASIEIVRSSGRSFAYMDFEPASDKALAKLFSTYNGCTWKGGKLKLEKAKEHYLDRLKQEWVEDTKLKSETSIDPDTEKDAGNSKLDRFEMENMQLRIYFPKLRKVKSLPFKGTGKHKYSFQRIEVPALPIHFCDCEEHNELSRTASNKYLSVLDSGVHYEKELNIMNSVMNKLLKKESNEPNTEEKAMLSSSENLSHTSVDDIHEVESEEESEVDADELVTNIGRGRRDKRKLTVNRESRVSKHQSSKNEMDHNKANTLKRKKDGPSDASEVTANKKAHLESPIEIIENEFSAILRRKKTSEVQSHEPDASTEPPLDKDLTEHSKSVTQSTKSQSWLQKSSWKNLVAGKGNSSFNINHTEVPEISVEPQTSKGQNKQTKLSAQSTKEQAGNSLFSINNSLETEISAEPQTDNGQNEQSKLVTQSARGHSWLQKNSWKDLVGGTTNSSFSITNVLPGISSLIQKQPKIGDSTIDTLLEANESNAEKRLKISPVTRANNIKAADDDEMLGNGDHKEVQKEPQHATDQKPRSTVSDVCTFMRSDESLKQWAEAKTALSRYLNKKKKKKDVDDSR